MDFESAVRSAKRTAKPSPTIERSSAKKLKLDPKNPNRSNERGAGVLDESLTRLKTGRSIVVDRKGVVIAGNQTLKAYQRLGKDDIDIVQSNGERLIVVQRTDLDLATDPLARELSLADNRTQELSYEVDPAVLAELTKDSTLDLSWMYSGRRTRRHPRCQRTNRTAHGRRRRTRATKEANLQAWRHLHSWASPLDVRRLDERRGRSEVDGRRESRHGLHRPAVWNQRPDE